MDTFHFKELVLGKKSYSPDGWKTSSDGVEFTITNGLGSFDVMVPWSNIAYEVTMKRYK